MNWHLYILLNSIWICLDRQSKLNIDSVILRLWASNKKDCDDSLEYDSAILNYRESLSNGLKSLFEDFGFDPNTVWYL